MKAAPEAQLRLLDLQRLDAAFDRLAHRRRTLPELAEVERLEAKAAELRDTVIAIRTEITDVDREQEKAEQDVEPVRARIERDQQRLDSGQVSSARELENLQSEIASLRQRQSELEEIALGVMERREDAQSRLVEAERDKTAVDAELAEATERRNAATREIDEEAESTSDARRGVAGDIPEDLLTLYEKLRGQYGGVGAAALLRGQCQGCHLALNTGEVNRIRTTPDDEVVRCEECRRILVRTPGSGL